MTLLIRLISFGFFSSQNSYCKVFFKKKWPFPASYLYIYFRLFDIVDSKQMFNKICRWLDSNHGPLVSEATALPTEPQPLPDILIVCSVQIDRHNNFIRGLTP